MTTLARTACFLRRLLLPGAPPWRARAGLILPTRLPDMRPHPPADGKPMRWELLAPAVYWLDGEPVVVPDGFYTDLTSTPWKSSGVTDLAALLHDWMTCVGPLHGWSFVHTNAVFYRALNIVTRSNTRGVWRRWWLPKAYWLGVATAGWIPWRKHRRQDGDPAKLELVRRAKEYERELKCQPATNQR